MSSGGPELFEKFEAQPWPEEVHTDEHGNFFYRVIGHPIGGVALYEISRLRAG
jgi:hypothetical protein